MLSLVMKIWRRESRVELERNWWSWRVLRESYSASVSSKRRAGRRGLRVPREMWACSWMLPSWCMRTRKNVSANAWKNNSYCYLFFFPLFLTKTTGSFLFLHAFLAYRCAQQTLSLSKRLNLPLLLTCVCCSICPTLPCLKLFPSQYVYRAAASGPDKAAACPPLPAPATCRPA